MAWRWYDSRYFPPSHPIPVRGGIKAQSKRGTFGESWWGRRWIEILESFHIGARLERGRSYARRGQVLSIDIGKGIVKARVQGSRPKPYEVAIEMKVLSNAGWKRVLQTLSKQARFAAKLLAGEMPQDIEEVFKQAGVSLFPERLRDLKTNCSCPDWSNPCKHIAAVYYLLGEEFDRDPFLLFTLRGMDREELLGLLSRTGQRSAAPLPDAGEAIRQPEPLPLEATQFWSGGSLPEDLFGEVQVLHAPAALPKRLGSFPFWRGEVRFLEAMEPIYTQASTRGMELFLSGLWSLDSPSASSPVPNRPARPRWSYTPSR
ncbi:MAG: SWIM zinc finger family protein [Armatimonadota bacterium]|nr:SWIM zinc finger family protein [Armatimonadota bacterium]